MRELVLRICGKGVRRTRCGDVLGGAVVTPTCGVRSATGSVVRTRVVGRCRSIRRAEQVRSRTHLTAS